MSGHALFSDLATILALPDPGPRFPCVAGFWHYAAGLDWARAGEPAAAEAEAMAIDRLIATADFSGLEDQYLPARDILAIARDLVRARVAWVHGDLESAEALVRAAIALEDGIGYREPPYWYYPLRQTLGAVLLEQGRSEDAAAAFEAALAQVPKNGWALWGLWQARLAFARSDEAEDARTAFERAWLGDPATLSLDRL